MDCASGDFQFRPNVREESRQMHNPWPWLAGSKGFCQLRGAYALLVRGIGGAENQVIDVLVGTRLSPGRPSFPGCLDLEHVFQLAPAMLTLIAERKRSEEHTSE